MPLTIVERRKQNRANAQHSKGPITEQGKSKSSQNSLKHGLTAVHLTLPGENPDLVQAQADAWHDALQPQDNDEEVLVDQLALGSLRLERIARAETAILAAQVVEAKTEWGREQQRKLIKYSRQLVKDAPLALVELQSFGAGARWLLDRWHVLQCAFETYNCWNNVALIEQAILLYGFDPDTLVHGHVEGYEFAVYAICCLPDYKSRPSLTNYLDNQMPPQWKGLTDATGYSVEEAQSGLRAKIAARRAELEALVDHFDEAEKTLRDTAPDRAMAPADTGQNRLLMRYMKATESSFDRTLKTLTKLQSERQKAAEKEAKEASREAANVGSPNEAELVGKSRSKRLRVGSCVTINGVKFEVVETSDGNILLCPWIDAPEPTVLGVVAAPETGV
jgi:hypothetical protein